MSSRYNSQVNNTSTLSGSSVFKTPFAPAATRFGKNRNGTFTNGTSTGRSFRTPSSTRTQARTPRRTPARTPGRTTINSSLHVEAPRVVVAIAEGRGQARYEVGMASIGLNSPHLILCQFTDTQNYRKTISKLNLFQPFEILMPSNICDVNGQPSLLFTTVQKEFPNAKIQPIQRKVFNDVRGFQSIKNLVVPQFESVTVTVAEKYYTLSAAAALLKYAELVHTIIFPPRTLRIEFQGSDKTTLIDSSTAQHLELLQNSVAPNSSHSLFGILNTCRTPMGSRLLRTNILQPPCDFKLINQRLDCVEELKGNLDFLYGLQAVLSRLPVDLDHIIASLIQIPKNDNEKLLEHRINCIIALKHTLELLPTFINVLNDAVHPYFQNLKLEFELPVFEELVSKIKKIINDEAQITKGVANMKMQRTFAVKPEVNAILDVARKVYVEIRDDVNQYVLNLSKDHNKAFRLIESGARGFFIQFTIRDQGNNLKGNNLHELNLPNHFLNVHRSKNIISFTTEQLIISDSRAKEVLLEIQNISSLVVSQLVVTIREDIGSLYRISEAIANLDVLHAFAVYALTECVRPKFSKTVTAIISGRHPILDSIACEPSVPNDTLLSTDTNFKVITGPNMSGKTTYLKQVAILQVMAQIGSFVPAQSATFRIATSILSRIGMGDCIEGSASTFALEMTEMNFILQNLKGNALVIIDELGRATSIEEGTAMSWAMAEALMSTTAFSLFATHFLFLTKLETLYPNVLNYKMHTPEVTTRVDGNFWMENSQVSRLKYTHIIRKGVTEVEHYGLKLAKHSSILPSVVDEAYDAAEKIIRSRQNGAGDDGANRGPLRRTRYLLASQLFLASSVIKKSSVNIKSHYLRELQREFVLTHGALRPSQRKTNSARKNSNNIHDKENAPPVDDPAHGENSKP